MAAIMDLFRIKSQDGLRDTRGKKISGKATYIIDGDTFKLYHTPFGSLGLLGGWGWLYTVPERTNKDNTFSVRLAGVDAPETAKPGKQGQPMSEESKKFVIDLLQDKNVHVLIHAVDQYKRPVATVTVSTVGSGGGLLNRVDVSYELLVNGLAEIYRGGGAEYGGKLAVYEEAEREAKKAKKGIWGLHNRETAAEYKRRNKQSQSHSNDR